MDIAVADSARVRVFAAEPPLSANVAAQLTDALDKLLRQFVREGRCAGAAAWTEHAGRFVVLAWDGPPLSGCSHDKIAQVVAVHERTHAVDLLASAPLAVGMPPQLLTRGGVRAELAAGRLTLDSPWWPLRADDLGTWRAGPTTVRASGMFAPSVEVVS